MNISDNNSERNAFDNETQVVVIQTIDTVSHVVNAFIAGFTVLLNCIVIFYLKTRRKKLPDIIWYQLFNLTIGDFVSGICFGLLCLTLISSVNTLTVACVTIVFLLSTSQSATLFNLCILSIKRWTIIRHLTQPSVSARGNLNSLLCSWVFSVLCHLPILASVTKQSHVNGCLSFDQYDIPEVFAVAPLVNFLALLVTNGVYVHSVVLLSKRNTVGVQLKNNTQSRTADGHTETNFEDNKTAQNRPFNKDFQENVNSSMCSTQLTDIDEENRRASLSKPKLFRTGIHKKTKMEQYTAVSKYHRKENNRTENMLNVTQTQAGVRPFLNDQSLYPVSTNTISNRVDGCTSSASEIEGEQSTLNIRHDDAAPCSVSSVISTITLSSRQVDTSSRTIGIPRTGAVANMTQRCHEKRAVKLLLTALITVNVATLSYIAIVLCFTFGVFKFDSNYGLVLDWQLLALNSLLNPIVYSFQVTHIRTALKEDLARLWRLVTGQCSS